MIAAREVGTDERRIETTFLVRGREVKRMGAG